MLKLLQMAMLLMTAATGMLALIKPRSVTGFTGLSADGARGISELRAIFGGLLIGLGVAPLLLNTTEAYRVVGIGYLAIAAARTFSVYYDHSHDQSNLISLAIEWVAGIILMFEA